MGALQQMQSYVVQNHARVAAYNANFNPVAHSFHHQGAVQRANYAHQAALMNAQRQQEMMMRQMQFAMNPMGMQRIGGFAQSNFSSTTTTSTASSSVGMMRPPAPPIGMAPAAVAPTPAMPMNPMMPMQPMRPAPMPAPMAAVHQQAMMVNPHAAMHQQAMAQNAMQMQRMHANMMNPANFGRPPAFF